VAQAFKAGLVETSTLSGMRFCLAGNGLESQGIRNCQIVDVGGACRLKARGPGKRVPAWIALVKGLSKARTSAHRMFLVDILRGSLRSSHRASGQRCKLESPCRPKSATLKHVFLPRIPDSSVLHRLLDLHVSTGFVVLLGSFAAAGSVPYHR
jgi:hypothetical protein